MERYITSIGQPLEGVHPPEKCAGDACVIHNPSDHHMKEWPMDWNQQRGMMFRLCEHFVGHPDPDDRAPDRAHQCDGCCRTEGDLVS